MRWAELEIRQELGESLHDAEHDGLEDHRARGYDARTFRPGFRGRDDEGEATSATLAACCPRRTFISRRLRMMAIVAAMNTVEYVPVMTPTSIANAKPAQHFAAEQIQRQHGQERRRRGDDRFGPASG